MRYTTIGTDEKISVIGLGMGKGIGTAARNAEYSAADEALIRSAVDSGITLIDTAFDYGRGKAEEALGRALSGIRDRVFIATKFPPDRMRSADVVRSAEESLLRLKTDRIDLFQTHWPNPEVPLEETLMAMERLVADGKVRYVGLSNCTMADARKARSVPVAAIQHEHNLIDHSAAESFIPFCRENNMAFIGYSPLAHTRLNAGDRRMTGLEEIARDCGSTTTQLVLKWLTREEGTVVVMRSSSAGHLKENAAIDDIAMSPGDYERITSLFADSIRNISARLIRVKGDRSQKTYATLEEARDNIYGLTPSPSELAEQIRSGEVLKPVKVSADPRVVDRPYEVVEGKLRYWAWVIACGPDAAIPSIVNGEIR